MEDVKMLKIGKFLTKSFTDLHQLLVFYRPVEMKLSLFLKRCLLTTSSLWFVYRAKFQLGRASRAATVAPNPAPTNELSAKEKACADRVVSSLACTWNHRAGVKNY